jgi:hypothetical protein
MNTQTNAGVARGTDGFLRTAHFGRVTQEDLRSALGAGPGDQIFRATVKNGVRTGEPVGKESSTETRPGDTFSVMPQVSQGASIPPVLMREMAALRKAGFGGVEGPRNSSHGYQVLLRGFPLANGVRTDCLILLPPNYPSVPPIGFYVREGTATGALDRLHFFKARTFHGAPDLSEAGFAWFCGVTQGWKPGVHTLVGFVSSVLAFFGGWRGNK